METTQRIPVIGKMYYWWLGRGKQKQNYKEEGSPRSSDLDKIFGTGGSNRKSLDQIFK